MIGYIKGKVIHRGANYLIADTGAVGYRVFVPASVLAKEEVALFTYQHIREDIDDLYGFESERDLQIFEVLLGVSGVGPKMALNIIGEIGAEKVVAAIARSEQTIFRAVSGVGQKLAAKIIVELKGKISGGNLDDFEFAGDDETVEALISLGYRRAEILPYLKNMPDDLISVQEKVKFVLGHVGKNKIG